MRRAPEMLRAKLGHAARVSFTTATIATVAGCSSACALLVDAGPRADASGDGAPDAAATVGAAGDAD